MIDFVKFGVLNCEPMEHWLPGSPYGKHTTLLFHNSEYLQSMTYLEGILDKISIVFTTANNKWKVTKY